MPNSFIVNWLKRQATKFVAESPHLPGQGGNFERGGAKRGPTYDGDCTLCMIYVAAPGDTFYSALFANVVTVTHFGVMARVVSGNISLMFLFHSLVEVLLWR